MIKDLFHTVATAGAAVGLTGTLAPLAAFVSLAGPRRADPVIRLYTHGMLKAAGVQHWAKGLENIPGENCVFICNHMSHFDPLVVFEHLPAHARFVAKAELFKIPVFGQALKATGNIRVDRKGSEADRRTMAEAVTAVRERVSVVFFPEGTRSEDGQLKPFKKGAFVLAIQAQVPIVPLAVAGTADILKKGTVWIQGGRRAVLVAGEKIPTAGLTIADRDGLMERGRAAVAALLEDARAELAR